ncbi:uncharacterized protein LOC127257763 [Andrographis paniculata]|uniref:uncharacterized protein LOC127257763 n=1 Tax=Andrographis paniculata TaxID=175694 RepID=UPI0021E6FAE9|nr:uncharacterized protein LOC127257763 [Andrographis paniculata]XP_051140179.1 uncharacterized protein LOC127257763 [Andrographis paniculata]XP_051140180.1 uncharacterized protein LOC127257763 [Andrographis paniculata]XP_051140181.1 uncharacterized protein LOC127257763 [Andrographis paniculata]
MALEAIKQSLAQPHVLMPPKEGWPLNLYLENTYEVVSCLLVQDGDDGKERVIYYLSKTLTGPVLNYTMPEKMCYSLVFACTKLEHYMLPRRIEVISKINLIKLILQRPTMQGRLMKWAIKLAPFNLYHSPLRAVKGQAIADFLADFASYEQEPTGCMSYVSTRNWLMFFYGSTSGNRSSAGVLLEGPDGQRVRLQLQLEAITHNLVEYVILGLEALIARKVQSVIIRGDSQLVINQVNKKYVCNYPHLRRYRDLVGRLLSKISEVIIEFIPRKENQFANELAQKACKGIPKDICAEVGPETETGTDWRT